MMSNFGLVAIFLALIVGTGESISCFNCESYTYLDADFTDIDSEEDRDCVAGTRTLENEVECIQGASCAVAEGTVTWFVEGYGFVDSKMTLRNCVRLLGAAFPTGGCFKSHETYSYLHQLIGDRYKGRELTNFNGTFCGCDQTSFCNDQPGSAPVITRGDTPKTNPRGLQCVSCHHQVYQDPSYQSLNEPNPSCSEAAIKSDSVYYHTCAKGGVCGVIEGQLQYDSVNSTYFGRDCLYGITDYPTVERTDGLLCVSRSNASRIVTSHLFSEAEAELAGFSGELCYCSTDFCELPQNVYSDASTDNHSNVNVINTGMLVLINALWGMLVLMR